MTLEEHKAAHVFAHRVLEDLLLDFITHTERRLSETPIVELLAWSRQQTEIPDETTNQIYCHERAQGIQLSEQFLSRSEDGHYDELIGDWLLAEGSNPDAPVS